jgi:hypothetical protein
MKRNVSCLSLFAIGIMAMLASGCSETGQFREDGILAVDEIENGASVPVVLTKSEVVALTVQQKGTYEISEEEALRNLDHFRVSAPEGEETALTIQ